MKIRPSDGNGDILPVIDSVSMRTGDDAVSELVKDRLNLLSGDWWENPAWGNMALDMFRESRRTEADLKVSVKTPEEVIRAREEAERIAAEEAAAEAERLAQEQAEQQSEATDSSTWNPYA